MEEDAGGNPFLSPSEDSGPFEDEESSDNVGTHFQMIILVPYMNLTVTFQLCSYRHSEVK